MTFDINKHVAFDVETSSEVSPIYALQPFRAMNGDAFLTSFAWARFKTDNRFDLGGAEMPEQAIIKSTLDAWIEQDMTVVGWNTAFDAAWLIALGFRDEVMRLRWLDGMLLWQHLEREPEYDTDRGKRRSFGLKQAVAEYMPRHAGYDEGVDFHDLSPAACAKRFKYNKLDAKFTLALARKFFNRLAKQSPQQLRNALIEASTIPMVADSLVHGLNINQDNAHALSAALQEVIDKQGGLFGAYAGLESMEACDKILASPTKLRALLFETWALPVQGRTAKGAPSTDKVALHALAAIDDRVKVVKDYREAKNNRTKFVENVLKSVEYNGDGKSRPGARIYGTYTGRVTFASKQGKGKEEVPTGFAIHQMKRAPEFRDLIEAPEGFVICEWDAAGQEYRWMAIESGDETMLSLCMPGEDPHGYMGAQIAHRDYRELLAAVAEGDKASKNNRQLGKVGNLSCVTADTEVLTPDGIRRIVDVRPSDLIWDGVEFVNHAGVVFNGYRKVITYQGLTATEDHQVLCQGQWTDFGRAAREGWHIDTAVWPVDDTFGEATLRRLSAQGAMSVPVRGRENCGADMAYLGPQQGLQELRIESDSSEIREVCSRDKTGCTTTEKSKCNASTLHQSIRSILQKLWRSWCTVQVCEHQAGCRVDQGAVTARYIPRGGHRPNRQQRALRARESSAGESVPQSKEQTHHQQSVLGREADPFAGLDGEPLLDNCGGAHGGEGDDRGGDSRPGLESCGGEAKRVADYSAEVAVYDILNCGPRNRFVANGLIVHNCQYRISAAKLLQTANVDYDMGLSMQDAEHIHNTYYATYPGVKQYWHRQILQCRRKGYAETIAGRRVQLKGSWTARSTKWKQESTAVNFPIQGIGADQKYLAMRVVKNYLTKFAGRFYFELHDGLYALLPEANALQQAQEIQQALNNLPYKKAWGFTPPIPLPWDLKMGKTWGSMKEIK